LVTFLTREKGLVTALAKNARQSIRRFGGNLLRPGTAAYYYIRQQPNRYIGFVERGEHNPKAPVLPPDPVCLALSSWALELVRAFEVHLNPALGPFETLLRHLGALSKLSDFSLPALEPRRLSLGFTKAYLSQTGFAAWFDSCRLCGRTETERWRLSPVEGGALCSDCAQKCDRSAASCPPGLLEALRAATTHNNCPDLTDEQMRAAELFFQRLATLNSGRPFQARSVLLSLLRQDAPIAPDPISKAGATPIRRTADNFGPLAKNPFFSPAYPRFSSGEHALGLPEKPGRALSANPSSPQDDEDLDPGPDQEAQGLKIVDSYIHLAENYSDDFDDQKNQNKVDEAKDETVFDPLV
jgi:DNA repair protein RecO (recombination protein O)